MNLLIIQAVKFDAIALLAVWLSLIVLIFFVPALINDLMYVVVIQRLRAGIAETHRHRITGDNFLWFLLFPFQVSFTISGVSDEI